MYSLGEVRNGLKNPNLAASKLIKTYNHMGNNYNKNGINIFDEEWDNLIILDACRYDYFSKYYNFDGKLEHRTSRGSTTREFIRGNFQNSEHYDTIYSSNNPWYKKIYDELGDDRSDIFQFEWVSRGTGESRELGHIRESTNSLTSRALTLQETYPHKRLIVHYLSPHEPYVDTDGNILMEINNHAKPENRKYTDSYWNLIKRTSDRENYVSIDEITQAYKQSVQYILNHIKKLIKELNGLTVITADHGELLGERLWPFPFFGFRHPEGVYMDELVKVPWFIYNNNKKRREIIEEDEPHYSAEESREVTEDVNERLRNMGYKL